MRIIAGTRKSRSIETLKGLSTRPTLDKVKEAVFSSLGSLIEDSVGLDLFAGSGSIGLEALSRGAHSVCFVEGAADAYHLVLKNVKALEFETQSQVYHMDVFQAIRYFKAKKIVFDWVYCDPPYGKIDLSKLMDKLIDITHNESMIILEEKTQFTTKHASCHLEKSVQYGQVVINYIRRKV
jgi:16S rRNA (guanine966-N2)-methyltransferase